MYEFELGTPGVYDIGILEPFIQSLDSKEEQPGMLVLFNLIELNTYLNDFTAAVGLHEYVALMIEDALATQMKDTLTTNRKMHMLKVWNNMAGREAAMAVFHFGKAIESVRAGLKNVPSIKEHVLHDELRSVKRQLSRDFPGHEMARHAAGHRAEAVKSMDELKRHAVQKDNGKEFILTNVGENQYRATFKGEEVSIGLDQRSREKLRALASRVYTAFPKLSGLLPPI